MNYQIETDTGNKIITVIVEGDWNIEASDALTGLIVDESRATGIIDVLIDHKEVLINVSNIVAYKRPLQLKSQFPDIFPRVAFVSPRGKYYLYRFFVTVARNRGIHFRVFRTRKAARDWLMEKIVITADG